MVVYISPGNLKNSKITYIFQRLLTYKFVIAVLGKEIALCHCDISNFQSAISKTVVAYGIQ